MKTYALIENGIVVNISIADTDWDNRGWGVISWPWTREKNEKQYSFTNGRKRLRSFI